MVSRRCVFFIGGYDPKSPEAFFGRLDREMRRYESTWNVTAKITGIANPAKDVGVATVEAAGDGWQAVTEFHFLGLDSIVTKDAARPLPVRIGRYLAAFLDYWLSGTAFAIFSRSWRFGLYFLYPFVAALLFYLVAWVVARLVINLAGIEIPGLSWLIALLALFPLLATLGKRWFVPHLMDLWSFSLEYLRGRRPAAGALLDRYADMACKAAAAHPFDEILFIGHSTGGGLILDLVARTLNADPTFAQRAASVSLLTLGSTALKFGLHPAAKDFRQKVQRIVDNPSVKWSEFQCMVDVVNFYGTNPVLEMDLRPRDSENPSAFPVVDRVHLRDMLDATGYKRIKRRFFRIHYQFIMANTRRYYYDFFSICFGPRTLSEVANPAYATGKAGR
ncbi:MAG: lipase [Rhizobiaceae bacterium]|nr:lipase [Rhizobiaceae bacterium]